MKSVKEMRALLSAYNKSVRTRTYKNIWTMKKIDLKNLIEKEFKITEKGNGRTQYRHKTGRFTKMYK